MSNVNFGALGSRKREGRHFQNSQINSTTGEGGGFAFWVKCPFTLTLSSFVPKVCGYYVLNNNVPVSQLDAAPPGP